TVRPSIRGLDESADILLVVDGLRINDSVSGAAYWDLPAAFIERVEILRGPASAIYGSNAILGVVSVTTRTVDHAIAGARAGAFQLGGVALEDDRGPYVGPLATLAREGRHRSRFLGLSAVVDRDVIENVRVFARASASSWRFDDDSVVEPPGWRSVGTVTDVD